MIARGARLLAVSLLRIYRILLSPILPPACRFVPSCSEFALGAIERHGVLRGARLAGARILRCHPLTRGGFDPVP
ncbi:MAG: membrane protein insertion efficiency factor YidD [Acidobacteria bacterium]|nr:MAG: membrane protein insertion efficiency factor YidD [Acidobacteriota bacterium]